MEIEPNILDKLIFNLVDDAGELCTDAKLRPFLVNQVNKDLFAIKLLDLSHMLLGKIHRFLVILIDNDSWTPLHGRLLAPKGRNGPSGLQVGGHTHCISLFVKGENMLGFNEVGNISFAVDTSHYKAAAWTAHILFGDQSKVEFLLGIYL